MNRPERIRADWLHAPACVAVMDALDAIRSGASRYVGGCVRNTLQGLPADDIDIATQLLPDSVVAALEAAGIRAVPTGLSHGTVTAVHEGVAVEITTLRRDIETDGRHARVAFTTSWQEDAGRRDFRMNAIYAGRDGTLHEFVSGSVEDALLGRVVFIGDPDARLIEDYLRILRFYRFNAWYGRRIDPAGQAACSGRREGLRQIAAERIWKELRRMLSAPDPVEAILAMERAGVLAAILPEASGVHLGRCVTLEGSVGLAPDPLRRLMALLPQGEQGVRAVAARLRLSGAEAARLAAWADPAPGRVLDLAPDRLDQALYWFGPERIADRAFSEADERAADRLGGIIEAAAQWVRPVFPLNGHDAHAAGHQGARIGDWLRRLEEAWVASGFDLTRDELLDLGR